MGCHGVGLVLGFASIEGLLGTVMLCTRSSCLNGVIVREETKDEPKTNSWCENLSVYSCFLQVASSKSHILNNIGIFYLSIFEFTARSGYPDYKHDSFFIVVEYT